MLSTLTRIGRTLKVWNPPILVKVERVFASFTQRDLIHETSDETGTLLIRFAKYIAIEGHKHIDAVPTKIRFADYFPISNVSYFQRELHRTTPDQLPFLIIFAYTYRSNADPIKFATVLNEIDALAIRLLQQMDFPTILRTLYALLFLMPNWITRTDFYRGGLRRLIELFSTDSKVEEFVQLCFYCGLEKKHHQGLGSGSHFLKGFLDEHLNKFLPQLNAIDLAIVANAAYKTATRVEDTDYHELLMKKTLELPQDNLQDDLLVTYLKAMRLERIKSINICHYLEKLCGNADVLHKMQATGLIHIFAYFAENLWDEKQSTTALVAEFIGRLSEMRSTMPDRLRPKDVDTFTWSCAQLNLELSQNDLHQIERVVLEKIRHKEFQYFPDQLVDTCLNMWILGYKSRHLLEETVYHKGNARLNMKQKPKVDSRYTVLLSTVAIEEPDWLDRIKEKIDVPFSLNKNPPGHLKKLHDEWQAYVEKMQSNSNLLTTEIVWPIKGINIPSLHVQLNESKETKETAFVELLHNDQVLQFSHEPSALLRLKMRLLRFVGQKVILSRPDELENSINQIRNVSSDTEVFKADAVQGESVAA